MSFSKSKCRAGRYVISVVSALILFAFSSSALAERKIGVNLFGICVVSSNGNGEVKCRSDGFSPGISTVVSAEIGATKISLGYAHGCAISNSFNLSGRVLCWGSNDYGQIDGGGATYYRTGVVIGGTEFARDIATGYSHSCIITSDKTVKCWGGNESGQSGAPVSVGNPRVGLTTVAGITNAVALSAGGLHTCALLDTRQVKCWGSGFWETNTATPRLIPGIEGALEVASWSANACARFIDGTVKCWGREVSAGPITATEAQLIPGLSGIISGLVAGPYYQRQCGIDRGSMLQCKDRDSTKFIATDVVETARDNSVDARYDICWAISSGNIYCQAGRLGTPNLITGLTIAAQSPQSPVGYIRSGAFYNPTRSGEGIVADIGLSNGQRTLVLTWYTYSNAGAQVYLVGSTPVGVDQGAATITLYSTRGARFGTAFNPASVVTTLWGTLTVQFSGCDAVSGTYASVQPGYGSGSISMTRLGPRVAEATCP